MTAARNSAGIVPPVPLLIRRLVLLFAVLAAAAVALAAFGVFLERRQAGLAAPQLADDPAGLPPVEVGLVLGTQPWTALRRGGEVPNVPFAYRLDAAAALWRAGKVKVLLVSGKRTTNDGGNYDEPAAMRAGLIERGVPAAAIYRDGEGWRTLDSILRARQVFGLTRLIIVSQRAHLERALYLARAAGIDAWGLVAREEGRGTGPSWLYRVATALLAWWDVETGTPPRAGPPSKVVIGVEPAN